MAYPPITALPAVPQRTQPPAEFATKGDAFLGALPAFRAEINTFGAYVDSVGAAIDADVAAADASEASAAASATAADASAQLALSYKDLAAGTANFKGAWSSLLGALAIPASVYHNGLTWVLLSNLANVAAAEPGISASWVVASGDSYRRFIDNIMTKATLDLDFSNNNLRVYESNGLEPKQLRRVVASVRGSQATYNSPTGIAVALANVSRIEYSPLTGACLGLLVEEQRTRLNTASALPVSPQNATVTAAAHTISFYGTGSVVLSGVHSATLSGTGTSARVTLTFTPSAGTLTMTPSGSVVDLQLELGSFATSIIRGSEGSQVTRSADVISRALTTTNANAGSIFVEFDLTSYSKVGNTTIVSLNAATQSNERGFALTIENNSIQAWIRSASSVSNASITVADSLQPMKALVSFDNIALKIMVAVNGVVSEVTNPSAVDISAFVSHLYIAGGFRISGAVGIHSKTVKRCTYIPRALTAAEAQALTA
jgi:hypothetical protein